MQTLYSELSENYISIIEGLTDTSLEVNFLDEILRGNRASAVLDVGCGVGRHCISLAKLGYDVTGIDMSHQVLSIARKSAAREAVDVAFYEQDANDFTFSRKFDAAICMWSTLAEEPMQYRKVTARVFDVLRPGGVFVIDNRNYERSQSRGLQRACGVTRSGAVQIEWRLCDRFTPHFRVRDVSYRLGSHSYRDLSIAHVLTTDEWIGELKLAGFREFDVFCGYNQAAGSPSSRVQIVAMK